MGKATDSGTKLEAIPPFVRTMRAPLIIVDEYREIGQVMGLKSKSDKRQDRPSAYSYKVYRKNGHIEIDINLRVGIEVDFYI